MTDEKFEPDYEKSHHRLLAAVEGMLRAMEGFVEAVPAAAGMRRHLHSIKADTVAARAHVTPPPGYVPPAPVEVEKYDPLAAGQGPTQEELAPQIATAKRPEDPAPKTAA